MTITLFNAPVAPVHSPVFILHGSSSISNAIKTSSLQSPDQYFEINNGFFKSIISLNPGLNEIQLSNPKETVKVNIEYVPLLENPPLHLCLLIAKDSPLKFDSTSFRLKEEGNDINTLIKKLKLAGRLMQLFTQQEMSRNGFGNRVFRFVEELQNSSLYKYEHDHGIKRNEIKIHVLRSNKTLKELRDPNLAQQNPKGTNTGGLFNIALEELRKQIPACNPSVTKSQRLYLAVMFLDTHWDPQLKLILTHAALGGGTDDIALAIFGSHGLWSWPKHLDEVSRYFSDETRSDLKEVANDCNECSSSWECLNITMGAFLHEIGHLYGCPHQENGIMLRDYVTFNRTFMTREARCIRTGKKAWSPVLSKDECHWHRLDLVRFLYHPAFALPTDFNDLEFKPMVLRDLKLRQSTPLKPVAFPTLSNSAIVESTAGVYLVTCHVGEWSKFHLEYLPRSVNGPGPQKKILLNYDELQAHLPPQFRNQRLDLEILSNGGEQIRIDDFKKFLQTNRSFPLQLPSGGTKNCFKSSVLGKHDGREQPFAIIEGFQVTRVRIHSGMALDGIEFYGIDKSKPPIPPRNYSLGSTLQKLNISSSSPSGEEFICKIGNVTNHHHDFKLSNDERISRLVFRSGAWVDAVQIVLNNGRSSEMFGGNGGGVSQLSAPDGLLIVGLYGYLGQWLNGIGIIYG